MKYRPIGNNLKITTIILILIVGLSGLVFDQSINSMFLNNTDQNTSIDISKTSTTISKDFNQKESKSQSFIMNSNQRNEKKLPIQIVVSKISQKINDSINTKVETDTNFIHYNTLQLSPTNISASITVSFHQSKPSLDLNQIDTFSTSVIGGTSPYTYSWTNLPSDCGLPGNISGFSCTPTINTGSYSIKLNVRDSTNQNASYTSTMTINSDPVTSTPRPSVVSGGIDAGQNFTLLTIASNGTGGYSYAWYNLPTGCSTSNTNIIACTPNVSGTFDVYVNVTDSNGFTAKSNSLYYIVLSDPTTTIPNPSMVVGGIDAGQNVTFSTTASNGTGSYTYVWYHLPTGCTTSNTNMIACTPTTSGSFNIYVNVTDSNGFTAKSISLYYIVLTDPVISTPSPSVVSGGIDAGQNITFSTIASNGTGTFSYSWTGLPTGCSTSNTNFLTCTTTTGGTFYITVMVTDSNNKSTASSSLTFIVLDDPIVSTPRPSIAPGGIDVDQNLLFFTFASNGTGSYSYAWHNLPTGCTTSNSNTINCTPTSSGTFNVYVNVTDRNGFTVKSDPLIYYILSDPTVTTPTPSVPSGGIDAGQNVIFSTTASNGTGSYSFVWYNLPTGCSTNNTNTLICFSTTSGTFNVYVNVTDTNGFMIKSNSLNYNILTDPTIIGPTASPESSSVDVGQSVNFTTTISGGASFFTYSWTGLPTGCSTANKSSILCSPTTQGTYSIYVTVTDSNHYVVISDTLSYIIISDPNVGLPTASVSSIDLGQSITFTSAIPTGGNNKYNYSWNNLPSGCTDSKTNSVSCFPTAEGTYNISVIVTDGNNYSVESANLQFLIYSPISVNKPNANVSSVDLGQSVNFSLNVVGGTGTYSYVYNGLPNGCTSSNSTTISCTPAKIGLYLISISVTDSNSALITSQSLNFNVYSLPTVSKPTPSISVVTVGNTVVFTTSASGGSGSVTYTWNVSSIILNCTTSNNETISCHPTSAGSYTITVTVVDSNGGTASATSSSISVILAPISSSSSSSVTLSNQLTSSTTSIPASSNNQLSSPKSTSSEQPNQSPSLISEIAFMGLLLVLILGSSRLALKRRNKNK